MLRNLLLISETSFKEIVRKPLHIISEPTVRLPPTYTTIWHGINANYSPLKRAPVNKGGRGGHLVKIKILVF